MTTYRFRPQAVSKVYTMKLRLRTGSAESYNWQSRARWIREPDANQHILRVFGQLHYLACHAPAPVQKKWATTYRRFMNRLEPKQTSVRYYNTWAFSRWL